MKKCVIIGSGLGGLSCGVILAKNGYKVTILEQGYQIGGCLQCFHRSDAVFDTGMHYIGSADTGQVLNRFMKYLGIDTSVELARLNPMGYDIISFQGEEYPFANGKENFVNLMSEHFPKNRVELERYYDLVKVVASSATMHSLKRRVDININTAYKMKSVNEVVEQFISDPLLQQIIVGIQPLYAGIKNHTPFITHALIHDCFEQSAFRIVGGSSSVASSLENQIKKLGGEIFTRQKAVKIENKGSYATAVIASSGERFPADIVISAIHPLNTLKLIDGLLVRPYYRNRIESFKNTASVFVVYLKFKKNSVKYMDHNLYYYRSQSTWGCDNYDVTSWPKFLLYMHFCHKNNPEYAETGKILTYMNFDEVAKWQGTHVGHRGEDYETFKRKKAELLIDALEEKITDIRYHVENYYTSTPLTYYDYTGAPEGAMYGLQKDVKAIGLNRLTCKTNIPNLLLAGQSVTSHGMFGVLAGSLITCSEVLSKETIFTQLEESY